MADWVWLVVIEHAGGRRYVRCRTREELEAAVLEARGTITILKRT